MKKIMVVDDEVLVRTGIKALIDWEKFGYQVVCDARDGKDARQKIQRYQPDIILTDLKMEPEDGFELIKYCKEQQPQIKLIVLSNYNDFENVRKAMKLGASDYVFKLMIKPDELLQILDEVGGNVEESSEDAYRLSGKGDETIRKDVLSKVEEKEYSQEEIKDLFSDISLKVDLEKAFKVMYLWVDNIRIMKEKEDFSDNSVMMKTIESTIEEILGRSFPAEIFKTNVGEFVIIINSSEGDKERESVRILRQYCYQYCGIHISISVSEKKCGWGFLREALTEVERIKKESLLRRREEALNLQTDLMPFELPEEFQIEKIKRYVEQSNIKGMLDCWERFFLFLETHRDMEPSGVKPHLRKMYILLEFLLQNKNIEIEGETDSNGMAMEESIKKYDNLDDLRKSVCELIQKFRKIEEDHRNRKSRAEVELVKNYVNNHLKEEISVALMAEMVNMSPSHFSHIFKEDTGKAFGEYVIQKRMDRAAKLLMETDMKINEIAEAVGIDNPNYFSTRFKKSFSVSPSDYKKDEK